MDDLGLPPYEAGPIEKWISRQLLSNQAQSIIADELVKLWESEKLLATAQNSTARFLLIAGFNESLVRVLKEQITKGSTFPWQVLGEILFKNAGENKELVDACLAGATRDHGLLQLATAALQYKAQDSRWEKIWSTEINDKKDSVKSTRDKLFEEIQIYKKENMQPELQEALEKILALLPDDIEAKNLFAKFKETADQNEVAAIRRLQERRQSKRKGEETPVEWPQLRSKLNKLKKTLDLNLSYEMAIGLHQMGLNEYALDVLRIHKNKWSDREVSFHLEVLISQKHFAEALGESEKILLNPQSALNAELLTALYTSAKAYLGLEDFEKAVGVLKGITTQRPDYRDVSILLKEIEKGDM